ATGSKRLSFPCSARRRRSPTKPLAASRKGKACASSLPVSATMSAAGCPRRFGKSPPKNGAPVIPQNADNAATYLTAEAAIPNLGFESAVRILLVVEKKARQFAGPLYKR